MTNDLVPNLSTGRYKQAGFMLLAVWRGFFLFRCCVSPFLDCLNAIEIEVVSVWIVI